MTNEDHAVIVAMMRYGGSFVKALALAAGAADPDNLARIKTAFPEYWRNYTEIANSEREHSAHPEEPLL